MKEIWRNIPDNPNYQASNLGNIRSVDRKVWNGKGYKEHKGRVLRQGISKKGYKTITGHDGLPSQQVHRLVAMAFIPNPLGKPQVNHIDGNKENNRVDNLEWCTNGENQIHAYQNDLNVRSEKSGKKKRPVVALDKTTREFVKEYPSISEATASVGGLSKANIAECCRGRKKTVYGFIWVFADEYERGANETT